MLPIGSLMLLYTADILLSYRALCLWRMNQKLIIINCTIFAVCSISSTMLVGFAIAHFTVYPTLQYATGCYSSGRTYYFLAPLPGLLFEIWIFVLVMVRAFKFSRGKRGKASGREAANVLQLLTQDAMWWFIFISFLLILNAVFLALMPYGSSGFFLPFARVFIIIMGCRLTVRMRKACHQNESSAVTLSWQAVDKDPVYRDTFNSSAAPMAREAEALRVDRVLILARRVGLPPALPNDLDAFWDDPIRTINHAGDGLELASLQTHGHLHDTSPVNLQKATGEIGSVSSPSRALSCTDVDQSTIRSNPIHSKGLDIAPASSSVATSIWRTDDFYEGKDHEETNEATTSLGPWPDLERRSSGHPGWPSSATS
ncbi:hypothetical protein FRB95_000771 [Tulasnella sp. JGI-2019a]|nr:hypothetical protein FRB95_000771 [Tulasnella sp. JGI-2019a]